MQKYCCCCRWALSQIFIMLTINISARRRCWLGRNSESDSDDDDDDDEDKKFSWGMQKNHAEMISVCFCVHYKFAEDAGRDADVLNEHVCVCKWYAQFPSTASCFHRIVHSAELDALNPIESSLPTVFFLVLLSSAIAQHSSARTGSEHGMEKTSNRWNYPFEKMLCWWRKRSERKNTENSAHTRARCSQIICF